MILGSLDNPKTHEMRGLQWSAVEEWVRDHKDDLPKDGEYPVESGGGIRVLVQRKKTEQGEELKFETHREHIDVQVCLEGSESIGWLPRSALANFITTQYDQTKDVELYVPSTEVNNTATRIAMIPGIFAVFYPDDAHMPLIRKDHPAVTKLVFKIPYEPHSTTQS